MNQSKLESVLEACANTASGFILSWLCWKFVVVPMIDAGWIEYNSTTVITTIFTVLSLTRSYFWRRFFNAQIHKLIKTFVKKVA